MPELYPDVTTIDITAPVDTKLEMAMLNAYAKGVKDTIKTVESNIIDVPSTCYDPDEHKVSGLLDD